MQSFWEHLKIFFFFLNKSYNIVHYCFYLAPSHAFNNNKTEVKEKEKEIEEAFEKAEIESHIADDSSQFTKEVDRSEHQLIEEKADVIKKGPKEETEEKYEEDEKTEEVIEEIFQVSDDGVTWKTVKKITTITPEGRTEQIVELGGTAKDLL